MLKCITQGRRREISQRDEQQLREKKKLEYNHCIEGLSGDGIKPWDSWEYYLWNHSACRSNHGPLPPSLPLCKVCEHLLLPPPEHSTASSLLYPSSVTVTYFTLRLFIPYILFEVLLFLISHPFPLLLSLLSSINVCLSVLLHLHSPSSSFSVCAPWPPHCRSSSTFSPASRHVVSSVSRERTPPCKLFFFLLKQVMFSKLVSLSACLSVALLCRRTSAFCDKIKWKFLYVKLQLSQQETSPICWKVISLSVCVSVQNSCCVLSLRDTAVCVCVCEREKHDEGRGKDPMLSMPAQSHNPPNMTGVCVWMWWFGNNDNVGLFWSWHHIRQYHPW